jgi:hypothetical protein
MLAHADAQDLNSRPVPVEQIAILTEEILAATPVVDIHTHLFAPAFGDLALWAIDNLLTYHYLEAELFRSSPIRPADYGALSRAHRADLIWKTLFVDQAPVSEAARGVIAVLQALELDTDAPELAPLRAYFQRQDPAEHADRVFRLAGVESVVMTNDPLDPQEARVWESAPEQHPRFRAALRLDRILNERADQIPVPEARRLVEQWCRRMRPLYMAVSLPDSFAFPAGDARHRLLEGAILPACRQMNLPLALMIGVRRQVNPALCLAGDASGRADLRCLETLCRDYPHNRFLVTVLSRENQHELCVYARKFANLLPFGCWWFLNNASVVEQITRERLEMLGTSFIAQNSDARVLEQLIYKWRNARRTIGPLLAGQFRLLAQDGRRVTRGDIQAAVTRLFRGNFEDWTAAAADS